MKAFMHSVNWRGVERFLALCLQMKGSRNISKTQRIASFWLSVVSKILLMALFLAFSAVAVVDKKACSQRNAEKTTERPVAY
ncbi:MAG: hypothetical protein IJU76_11495 [Desulfovibrionaceae bacterium]|nr:hypothetical protein [Desulfovibrionaceae bacterium]